MQPTAHIGTAERHVSSGRLFAFNLLYRVHGQLVTMTPHPYIPNSNPEIKKQMLDYIGVKNVDELFAVIPEEIRCKKRLDLPTPTPEHEMRRQIDEVLSKNKSDKTLCFLGAGCWPHYVPAICDEINSRSEYLTAYTGDVYTDLGRYQALFEFQSMIGELVAMDAVTFPTYDWPTACGDAARMAAILTNRKEILVPKTISPDRLSVMRAYCRSLARINYIEYDPVTGQIVLEDLRKKLSSDTAAVYIENPSYLGFIETQCDEIAKMAHEKGALFLVGVEPLSLGILTPPGEYGADIVCGEGQPLGLHMTYGGTSLGFIACPDEERFLTATGHRLLSITTTSRNEWGFTYVLPERSMLAARDRSASITGTATVLWAITAAVYLSLLGPSGIRELAEIIVKKSHYAMKRIRQVTGLSAPLFEAPHFEEFTLAFGNSHKSVQEINSDLRKHGIQGGKDISKEFPELGNAALYCVTEVHTKTDIDSLVSALEESLL
jgi:glycine dehydrogenase subunit 1